MPSGIRRLKKLRRTTAETTEVIEKLVQMCGAYGRPIEFVHQLPEVFEAALRGSNGRVQPVQRANAKEVLDLIDTRQGARTTHIGMKEENLDLYQDLRNEFEEELEWEPEKPKLPGPGVPQEILDSYEDATARMLERVERDGVRYSSGGAPSPAEGKRLRADPNSTPKRVLEKTGKAKNEAEEDDLFDFENEEEEPPINSGRVNPKTGMALEESRRIIEKITGKAPKPPGGGMPIPPGFKK